MGADLVRAACWSLGHNLAIAGGLEMQRRLGQWDRIGYWKDKP